MSLSHEQLRSIPLFAGLSDEQLDQMLEAFNREDRAEGEILFRAGDPAVALYVLASGKVTFSEGDNVRMHLHPPAPIGELGALSGVVRNTTATVTQAAEVWSLPRAALADFLEAHQDLALVFYQNLTQVVADKIRRDQLRLEDMRTNLIRTQKTMKELRDFVLETEDTPVSERIHDALQGLIRKNRRVNYRVAPPQTLPAKLRINGEHWPVVEISRTHISYTVLQGAMPNPGDRISGVVFLAGPELPVSGVVLRTIDRRVDVELDLLIDEYVAILEGYLSRVQMVDFVV